MIEEFISKKDSWHYKMIRDHAMDSDYFDWRRKLPKNYCAYWRMLSFILIAKFLVFAFYAAVVVFIISLIGFYLINLYMHPVDMLIASGLVIGFVFVAGLLASLPSIVKSLSAKVPVTKTTSSNLFVTKYKSWKSKICPAVTYEE